jgi:hypothetical protein
MENLGAALAVPAANSKGRGTCCELDPPIVDNIRRAELTTCTLDREMADRDR